MCAALKNFLKEHSLHLDARDNTVHMSWKQIIHNNPQNMFIQLLTVWTFFVHIITNKCLLIRLTHNIAMEFMQSIHFLCYKQLLPIRNHCVIGHNNLWDKGVKDARENKQQMHYSTLYFEEWKKNHVQIERN